MSDPPSAPAITRAVTAAVNRVRATNAYVVDTCLAVAVAIPLSVPFLTPSVRVSVLGALLNLGTVVPLVWRRRAPFIVTTIVGVFASLVSLYHHPGQMLQYAGLVVFYTIADLGSRWQRWTVLAVVLITFPPTMILLKHNTAAEFMFTLFLPMAAYLLGALARTNRAQRQALAQSNAELERRRDADAARARAEERTRIARDMHDVLAHAVSVMVVQAEAGPVVVRSHPERAEEIFDVIADAGRAAMLQLSNTLGVLKSPDDAGIRLPQPTVAAIPALVEQVRRAGLGVDLRTQGTPVALRADTEVAAYRIVQEALTNTLKHARADTAEVRLDWRDELRITVTDDGSPCSMDTPAIGGHGLAGIRERAAACGGHADAGPTSAGFRVVARLPLAAVAAGVVAEPV